MAIHYVISCDQCFKQNNMTENPFMRQLKDVAAGWYEVELPWATKQTRHFCSIDCVSKFSSNPTNA